MSGALTGDVASMGSPLTGNRVLRVHDPDGTSLVVGPSPHQATAESNRPTLAAPAHTRVLIRSYMPTPRPPIRYVPAASAVATGTRVRHASLCFTISCIASCESPTIAWPAVFSTRACRPLALATAASRASPPGSGTHISNTLSGSERDGQGGHTTPPLTLPLAEAKLPSALSSRENFQESAKKKHGFEYPPGPPDESKLI